MLKKILIANRGEIAVRIMRTCKAQGYQTVAVYSDADSNALHVSMADESVHIGRSHISDSYLNIDKIIDAAAISGADAIHPGYGFLSENAEFARACEQADLCFIGPSPDAIELMGSKRQAKIAMINAGVPCVPGYEGDDQNNKALIAEALKIGLPVMVKASAGGGGRGMRLVTEEARLDSEIDSARSEATSSFGSGELIIEKALINPRHIEIQIFADKHGNCVYLGERDCSVQRRHQKVVEEAPSPFVDETLRAAMGESAVAAANSCGYVGAGTVEFLVDDNKNFYFLEMNTRLQVEHPVTEHITGLDLVALQLDVAAGQPLGLTQSEVTLQGHAIEVRLYAEDPARGFLPQTGNLLHWQPAHSEGTRIDSGIVNGSEISPFYDPMLAKLIAFGDNREQARRRLVRLLQASFLAGFRDNRAFLADILDHPAFIDGQATTGFIDAHMAQAESLNPNPTTLTTALAATVLAGFGMQTTRSPGTKTITVDVADQRLTCHVVYIDSDIQVQCDAFPKPVELNNPQLSGNTLSFNLGKLKRSITLLLKNHTCWLNTSRGNFCFTDVTLAEKEKTTASSTDIRASMDGLVVACLFSEGDTVSKGDAVVVVEAMKMEHPLKAQCDGQLSTLHCKKGEQVKARMLLAEIAPSDSSTNS
ncbi:Acetyl-/propionyl-coenzyme A carboxylase alpha chain [BD1-7 clade bacterium]|uniref:Biotin carboxylase n=1 Tax=BD1-7 clade bacterium TaxID=2029982 RepID=A0A5S9NU62_9GAMM|nr:Acetyl-/propionyl-coenzyme A carboxylase alpha chain [BD1-7 clade bacterium]CAA0094050.1 Acetyl-/propionyl-coenzyme A carboxylase alpha chain [BD1-7 clade bacterium]